jgi:hypothetical protein
MGRANNSFSGYVGHAAETHGESVPLPEQALWIAVLSRAALDAFQGAPNVNFKHRQNVSLGNHFKYDQDQARHFFLHGGEHFREICEMAGRNPAYVREKVKKLLLRSNGWNVDVPITSHYRQGPKRGRTRGKYKKKHLTGNAYYAAKAAKGPKNFYYQDMGRKGGRPRIYNKIEP